MTLSEIPTNELIAELEKRRARLTAVLGNEPLRDDVDRVLSAVCRVYGIHREALVQQSRVLVRVLPRWMAMTLFRELGWSCVETANALGVHHTTVIYGLKQSRKFEEQSADFRRRLAAAREAAQIDVSADSAAQIP